MARISVVPSVLLALFPTVVLAQTKLETNHQPPVTLRIGDRLAIIGDSITEQKLYSRMMESYLTLCRPELKVDVRQLGWSGETATGFVNRMQDDCLRFKPTVATTCYGMNDHGYRKYEPSIGDTYRTQMSKILDAFAANNVRTVVGSPGIVGKKPTWVQGTGTIEDMNDGLAHLHNIGLDLARERGLGFATVYEDMSMLRDKAKNVWGTKLEASGADGVHPGAAGHLAMAYAFLESLGMGTQELARFTVDLAKKKAIATDGHSVTSFDGKNLKIHSTRYPFVLQGSENPTNSSLEAAKFIPWNQDLNRFMLVVKGAKAQRYNVKWGQATKTYTREQLAAGVNLAADFPTNPFSDAFAACRDAIGAKQAYETEQIKMIFRSAEYKAHPDWYFGDTERVRASLQSVVHSKFVPVDHTITITVAK